MTTIKAKTVSDLD